MWIIKLGGSLAKGELLPDWLDVIQGCGRGRAIIVPGGGGYADTVRDQQRLWAFDDATAHSMALLAMDQYGHQLVALGNVKNPGAFRTARQRAELQTLDAVSVWLPSHWMEDERDVARNWDITSDSLALWLAVAVGAKGVLLIKSLTLETGSLSVDEACRRGWIDAAFPDLLRRYQTPAWLLGISHQADLYGLLEGHQGAGLALI